jgi:hypothetical protein
MRPSNPLDATTESTRCGRCREGDQEAAGGQVGTARVRQSTALALLVALRRDPGSGTVTPEDLDRDVRREVYAVTMDGGRPPLAAEVGGRLGVSAGEVRAAFERLAAGRVLVLQPGSGEVLMANPFSAVPTPFAVEAAGRLYFANCIWDALGVPAMLGSDGRILASCGCCGAGMPLAVENGALQPAGGVVHFAVPARRWWEDIVFT